MFEQLSTNLNQLMHEKELNASELARLINLPASTIKKIRNGDNPNPTLATLLPIAKFFAITLSQLVGEEPLQQTAATNMPQPLTATMQRVPLLPWRETITWPHKLSVDQATVATEHIYDQTAYALEVQEDNWENFTPGTVLIIDPTVKPNHRDFVIVYKQGLKLPTLKQALFDEERLYLKPVVPGYHFTTFTPEHRLLGVVMEYHKQLRNPPINHDSNSEG